MRCYNCGAELGKGDNCQNCGTNVKVYKKILMASNAYYNDALEKAGVRDLSGAIESLKISLRFNKLNIVIKYHYWNSKLIKEFKKLALSIFIVTLIDQVFFKTNQIILGIISGPSDVAVYAVAAQIYLNYMVLSQIIVSVYVPYVTELVNKK